MLTTISGINGYSINSLDGEIGKVKDFYFDDRYWAIRYLVVDTGKWLVDRKVLISPYALDRLNKEEKQVAVDLSKKQIEESPSLDTDKPVSKQFEDSYYAYYGWPAYWYGSFTWGYRPTIIHPLEKRSKTNPGGKSWNPNLRSTIALHGYHIQAIDGEIGHVKDFIINDDSWEINYLVVSTKNWLPGKTVLISPKWLDHVSWEESEIFVNLSRDAIKDSPEYSEEELLSREYETKLHGHYNVVGYWIEE